MPYGLDPLIVFCSTAFLCLASVQDVRSREIDDRIWIAFGAVAAAYFVASLVLEGELALVRIASATISSVVFYALGYVGFYGGADVKALICISVALPLPPTLPLGIGPRALPFFPLTVFNNAILASLLFVPANLLWNVMVLRREGNLFSGYSEPAWKKAVILVAARKVKLGNARKRPDMMVSEKLVDGRRQVLLWPRETTGQTGHLNEGDLVFAHYLVPMIVPVTVGLALSAITGDILMGLVFGIV